jgi:hypothetical protein
VPRAWLGLLPVGQPMFTVIDQAFDANRKSPHFGSYVQGTVVLLLSERQWDRYGGLGPDGSVRSAT